MDLAAEYGRVHLIKDYIKTYKNLKNKFDDKRSVHAIVNAAVPCKTIHQIVSLFENPSAIPDDILHAACRHRLGNNSISFLLQIKKNALGTPDQDGFTPLMVAVKHRRLECVQELLTEEQDMKSVLSVQSKSLKYSVFHICAEIQHDKITDILAEKLASLPKKKDILIQQDRMGNIPLHICAQKGNAHMCEWLINIYRSLPRSIPGNTPIWLWKNYAERSPFQEAVHNSRANILRVMLNTKLIPETSVKTRTKMIYAIDKERRTNLHIAALKGN